MKEAARGGRVEPLLPVEKKLIGWSLGLMLGIVIVGFNHLAPIGFQ